MVVPGVSKSVAGVLLLAVGLGISRGEDPCDDHTVLTEGWREPGASTDAHHCDEQPRGWYSFVLDGSPAVIPTLCLQDQTCGARVPLHLDLEGQSLPEVGGNVTGWLCGSYNVLRSLDCCVQRQSVTVKRCDDSTFVYYLQPQRVCPVAVCAKRMADIIPEEFVAKPGDIPRSVTLGSAGPADDSVSTVSMFRELCPEGLPECPDGSCGPCPSTVATTPPAATLATTAPQEITRLLRTMSLNPSTPPAVLNTNNVTPDVNNASMSSPSSSMPISPDDSPSNVTSDDSVSSMPVSPDGFPSNVTSDDPLLEQDNATTAPFHDLHNSTDGATSADGLLDMSPSSNVTSSTKGNMGSDKDTDMHNTTDTKSSEGVSTPEVQPSPGTLDETSTPTVLVKTPSTPYVGTVPTGPLNSTGPVPSSGQDSAATSSRHLPGEPTSPTLHVGSTRAPATASVPSVQDTFFDAVRFVVNGTYEESDFRDALLLFVNNVSGSLTKGNVDVGIHNLTIRAFIYPRNITLVDVDITDPMTNDTIPATRLVTIIENDNFAGLLLSQTGQRLVEVCPSSDKCDGYAKDMTGIDGKHRSLFDQNRGVFIAVIVLAALCLLVLLLGLLFIRCRRQGVWVLAPDHEEKGPEPLAIESPMTDHQILQGEGGAVSETTLTLNGDHPHTPKDVSDHQDIPAADEDNGWVVPLDQAPPSQCLAEKTEDTQF